MPQTDLAMKRYEYVSLDVAGYWLSLDTDEHRAVIDDYANRGYRYVGFIPTKQDTYGKLRRVDLIFEREADAPTEK